MNVPYFTLNHADTCSAFMEVSKRTWYRVMMNHNTPVSVREDAITALNLQDMQYMRPREIVIYDFTSYQEGHLSGADWEWWFCQPGCNFGMAIQAKLLTRKNDYRIRYTRKRGRASQIEVLLDYSSANGLFPAYCFYSWWNKPPKNHWPCVCYKEQSGLWGCSLADAYAIHTLSMAKRCTINDIFEYTYPWHCLVCCDKASEQFGLPTGIATRAAGVAYKLRDMMTPGVLPFAQIGPDDTRHPEPVIHEELPQRISELQISAKENGKITAGLVRDLFGEVVPKFIVVQKAVDD